MHNVTPVQLEALLAEMAAHDTNPTVLIKRRGTAWRTARLVDGNPCQINNGDKPFEPESIDALIEKLDTAKAAYVVAFRRHKHEFYAPEVATHDN
jgi:hypothetical protein